MRWFRFVLLVYLVNKVFITLPALLAAYQVHHGEWNWLQYAKYIFFTNFVRWDAEWFERIAQNGGYPDIRHTAFFPLYPLLSGILMRWTHYPFAVSGAVISNLSFVAILYVAIRLLRLDYNEAETKRIVWIMGLYPTSYYFSATYTESLYFLFFLLCLYFMRKGKWALSATSGFFAAATRNTGVFLTVPYTIECLGIRTVSDAVRLFLHGLKAVSWQTIRQLAWVLIIPASVGLYMLYLEKRFGDPLAFAYVQAMWGRSYHNPFETIFVGMKDYLYVITHPKLDPLLFPYALMNVICVLMLIFVLLFSFSKMRLSYWIILLYSFLIPLSNPVFEGRDYFMSITRYSLTMFPLYIGLYEIVKRSRFLYYLMLASFSLALMMLMYAWTANIRFIA